MNDYYCHTFENIEKGKYFPFSAWNKVLLLAEQPYKNIIANWPARAKYMLRAIDIIANFLPPTNKRVLEVGSGPAICAGLMSDRYKSKHVLIDLPEQIVIGYSFLSEFFPNLKVILPDEANAGRINSSQYDIVFITPEQINLLEGTKFDIGINMFSFQEMSLSTVQDYILLFRNVLKAKSVFYCMNRKWKKNVHDNFEILFEDYGWKNSDKILFSADLPEELTNYFSAKRGYVERLFQLDCNKIDK